MCIFFLKSIFISTPDETSETELRNFIKSSSELAPLRCTVKSNLANNTFILWFDRVNLKGLKTVCKRILMIVIF